MTSSSRKNHKNMLDSKRLVEKAMAEIGQDFAVIGRSRIVAWQAWLLIGLAAGVEGWAAWRRRSSDRPKTLFLLPELVESLHT